MVETKYLSITAADIRDGIKGSCNYCPIALSAQRKFQVNEGFTSVSTDLGVWKETLNRGSVTFAQEWWKLSATGLRFIHEFDRNFSVAPCKIRITRETVIGEA